jgi:hypothetical protein
MQSIQNAVRRFFALSSLLTIKAALLRACRQPAPPIIAQPESAAAADTALAAESDTDTAYEDAEDQLVAWETERASRLDQVESYEQQGRQLLAKAALLRAALTCEDRGETFIAEELREHAETLGRESTTEAVADTVSDCPTLEIIGVEEVSAQPGV